MSKRTPVPFEIWRFAFEYEDKPGISKERPVVIGASDEKNALVLVVKVTSHKPRKDYPGEVALRDWKFAGLEKPSTARCSKVLLVPIEAFADARFYGCLSQRDSCAIEEQLRNLNLIK